MCTCVETISPTKVVRARKDYKDSCMDYIMESMYYLRRGDYREKKLSFTEWRLIAQSIKDKWVIKKGELHEVQVNKSDGHIYSFRSKPGLSKICSRLNLWGDC